MDPARLGLAVGLAGLGMAEHVGLARAAESAGFGTAAVGELTHDAFAAVTALAGGTARSRVMTGVATWARPPVVTARAALTVAELAPGRFVMGLGSMPPAYNLDHVGIDPARPLARLREYLAVVRGAMRCTATDPLNFAGDFFTVRDYRSTRAAAPAAVPPIHLAASRADMARFAGRHGDGVLFNVVHTLPWLREVLLPAFLEGAAGRVGSPETGVMLRTVIHDGSSQERSRAHAMALMSLQRYRTIPYFRQIATAAGHDPDGTDEHLVQDFVAVGTAEELRARCQEYLPVVDWVEITPVAGVGAETLRDQYRRLMRAFAGSVG